MREMILNHASLAAPDVETGVEHLIGIASGMAALVEQQHTYAVLRSREALCSIPVTANQSFYDVLLKVRRSGHVDEYRFVAGLANKVPLLDDVPPNVANRFLGCEAIDLSAADGEPIVLCAQTGALAVGFPSAPTWDADRIVVRWTELQPNETYEEIEEAVDHLSRANHAVTILGRARTRTRLNLNNGVTLWAARAEAFPAVDFGPDVEDCIQQLAGAALVPAINRLAELNDAIEVWKQDATASPIWPCKVTPESANVENNPVLREARRFRSISGERELFLMHARIGSGIRIHLRVDPAKRTVEIGYIGPHLPL